MASRPAAPGWRAARRRMLLSCRPMHLSAISLESQRFPAAERYPFTLGLLRRTTKVAFPSALTCFVGENGTGKSTLLSAVARACGIHIWRMEGGRRIERNPYEDALSAYVAPHWSNAPVPGAFFASETFHDFAQLIEDWAANDPGILEHFGGRSLLTLSHGQSLMSYFSARFEIKGLYLLDEPETALSPKRQLELAAILDRASTAGRAQFIVATHSPILMACANARLLSFDSDVVLPIELRATDHYRVYRDFLLGA
jgi:predicted ATPase